MKNELRKAWELIKFGVCVNKVINILFLIIFVAIGIVGEIFYLSTGISFSYGFDISAFLLLAAVSFPAQFLITNDVAHVVQTSSYKKKIQTKMFAEVLLVTTLFAMTVFVLARAIATAIHPEFADKFWADVPWLGALTLLLLVFTEVIYKYFWAALIALYVFLMFVGGIAGYQTAVSGTNAFLQNRLPIAGNIVIGYVLAIVGVGAAYLLSLAIYKKPFSKAAFGAAMSKYV